MRLNHHRRGRGEPLVLVHGIGSQWQIWLPVLGLLAAERDVVAVDLPGFGESLMLRDELPTVEALAGAVRGFCESELGWETAHVGGFSLGGGITLELARTGFARSACAISPVGFASDRELAWSRRVLSFGRTVANTPVPRSRPMALVLTGGSMAQPWKMPADRMGEGLVNLADSPGWEPTLEHGVGWRWPGGALDCPVTIAWGTLDVVLLPTQARTARRVLPSANHVLLRGRGHVPTWEAPEEVAALLLGG